MPLDRTGLWEFLGEVEGALERPITLVAVGGTALTLLDVKPSTLDIDFTGPGADIRAFLEALRRTPHGFRVQAWEDAGPWT